MEQARAAKVLVVGNEADQACVLTLGLRVEGFEVETAVEAEGRSLRWPTGRSTWPSWTS